MPDYFYQKKLTIRRIINYAGSLLNTRRFTGCFRRGYQESLPQIKPYLSSGCQYPNQNQQTTETEEDIHLRAAANYLNSGHYKEALNVLSGIKDRSARWYYYSSIANSGMGNNVLALEHAKEALRLEPSNYQYQSLVSRLENGGSWYRTQQTMYGGTPTINNDFCVKLCIANIMCNLCCGGGGFFCGSPYTYH